MFEFLILFPRYEHTVKVYISESPISCRMKKSFTLNDLQSYVFIDDPVKDRQLFASDSLSHETENTCVLFTFRRLWQGGGLNILAARASFGSIGDSCLSGRRLGGLARSA